MLSYFEINSFPIFHIDNTYQINKARYPLLAFGRTDYSGHFFPIAMALIGREKALDFIWFFTSLKKFCFTHFEDDLEKIVKYICMDACDAEYNATSYHNLITGERCFPLAVFLMCWFHVEFNVGKHIISKSVPKELIPMVKNDIKMLHATLSEGEFKTCLAIFCLINSHVVNISFLF